MPPSDQSKEAPPLHKLNAWLEDGAALARSLVKGAIPGVVTLLILAAVFLTLALRDRPAGASSAFVHLVAIAGVGSISTLAIGFLVAIALRCRRLFSAHLQRGADSLVQAQAILQATREGLLVVDAAGRIRSMNPAAERIFAQMSAALLGQNAVALIPDRTIWQDLATGTRDLETEGLRHGNERFPLELRLRAVTAAGQSLTVALLRDVSEAARSSAQLRQIGKSVAAAPGEDFNRQLVKRLSQTVDFAHAFLIEILGEGPSAVSVISIAQRGEIRGPIALDLRHTIAAEVLSRGARTFNGDGQKHFPEDHLLADHGAISFSAVPLQDQRGRTLGAIGVLHREAFTDPVALEATLQIFASRAASELERKRCEDALGAEKERLAVTLRSISEACITLDNDGRVAMFNPIAERLTGWLHDDAAGKLVQDVLHLVDERTRRRAQHFLQRIAATGSSDTPNAVNILISRDGQERLVESSSAPIRDRAGRKLGAIIVLRDVTERKLADEERQKAEKLESLGLVAGGIAHDFNNLLTTILGNVTLALGTLEIAPRVAERLTAARKASQRAQELAGQLLTFAKGGAPVKQAIRLGQLLTDTMNCTIASSRTLCETQIPDDLWPIEADPGQIAQVIANLTANAEQALPAGGTVTITAENLDLPLDSVSLGIAAGRWVRFSIEDNGVGIPEQYLKKIFDPYFTTKPTGSGLGLAAAYSVVKNHSGVILVESTPGVGSNFSIYLPASEKPIEAPARTAPVPIGSGRVLILDDEEAICMLVTCALEPLGYEVTEVQDGAVALEKYEEAMRAGRKYDLVISDLTMPGRMSGQEAIRRLREIDPDVRAIVSSGYANDPVMSRYQEFGFSGMIAKPYEIDALGRKVAEVLAQPVTPRVIYHSFEARKTA